MYFKLWMFVCPVSSVCVNSDRFLGSQIGRFYCLWWLLFLLKLSHIFSFHMEEYIENKYFNGFPLWWHFNDLFLHLCVCESSCYKMGDQFSMYFPQSFISRRWNDWIAVSEWRVVWFIYLMMIFNFCFILCFSHLVVVGFYF